MDYDQFLKAVAENHIYKDDKHPLELLIEEGSGTQTLSFWYSKLVPPTAVSAEQQHTTVLLDFNKDLEKKLDDAHLSLTKIRNRSKC